MALAFTSKVASFVSTLRKGVPSIYKQTTVAPVSSATAPVQNAATLGGQAEHASLPSLGSPSTDSGYLGALPVPVTNSLGGFATSGVSGKTLLIGAAVLLAAFALLHYARR